MEIEVYCKIHSKYVIQWIQLGEKDVKLGCIICLEEQSGKLKDNEKLFLHDIVESPLKLLLKLKIKEHYQQFYSNLSQLSEKQIMEQYQLWETNLRNLQQQIDTIIKEQKLKTQNLIQNYKEASQAISKEMNQENLISLLKELRSPNCNQEIYDKIQKDVKAAFEELQKDEASQINKSLNEITDKYRVSSQSQKLNDLSELDREMKEIMKKNLEYNHNIYHSFNICNIEFKEDQHSKIISKGYMCYLFYTIQQNVKQELKSAQRLYQSTQDGLTSSTFWNKVNGKKNLLLIFKSKNTGNNICGAYINCQFNGSSNTWQQDNSSSSFIFSYTHNEIYPLKQAYKANAIYLYQSSQLIYIGSQDIYIQNDFINGHSNLGQYYQWDKSENKQSTHLFGGTTPNIGECEVYEIQM